MIIMDIVILTMIAATFFGFRCFPMLDKSLMPMWGRRLILGGVGLAGLFFFTDLIFGVFLPSMIGAELAAEAMLILHLDIRSYTAVVSFGLIGSGMVILSIQRQRFEKMLIQNQENFDQARQILVESEARFRSLIEHSPDGVYCLEFDPPMSLDLAPEEQVEDSKRGVFVECNQEFANKIGADSPAEVVGRTFGSLESIRDSDTYRQFYSEFIENDYCLDAHVYEFVEPSGEEIVLKINFNGVIEDGKLIRIWGSDSDFLTEKRMIESLESRRAFESFVAALSARLLTVRDDDATETLIDCLHSVCKFLGSDRASILSLDRRKGIAEVLYYWNEHGGPPWVEFSVQTFPWVGGQVSRGRDVRISTLDDMPPEAAEDVASLEELGLKSVVAVPLIVSGKTLGVLTFGNIADERNWSDRDLLDIRVIADLFANVISRLQSRKELDLALGALSEAKERLEAENVYLRQEISSTHGFDEICGESAQLRMCLHQVQQVAGTTTTVLIQGETGTGKELIARAVHQRSDRADRPLVKVNCAALPANLIESELFGHEKGAYTGAHNRKRGRFDLADGGTLFLDEIGDCPLELQGKLLRVIQEGEFQRLGGTETIQVDVRLITATNRDLQYAVDGGEFRADLFYRINTFPINLPTLAERDGDIPILAEHIVKKQAAILGKEISAISASFMEQLVAYPWPGNVRELESYIKRALILNSSSVLDSTEVLLAEAPRPLSDLNDLNPVIVDLHEAERAHIENVLINSRWVIGGEDGAAEKLGIPPSTLRSKMKKLGIIRPA